MIFGYGAGVGCARNCKVQIEKIHSFELNVQFGWFFLLTPSLSLSLRIGNFNANMSSSLIHCAHMVLKDSLLKHWTLECSTLARIFVSLTRFAKFDWSLWWWKIQQSNYDTFPKLRHFQELGCGLCFAFRSDYSKYNPASIYQLNHQSKCNFFPTLSLSPTDFTETKRSKWRNWLCRLQIDIASTCNLFIPNVHSFFSISNWLFSFFVVILVK